MAGLGGAIRRLLRRNSPLVRTRGSVMRAFARKAGLVYFGSVDQHGDDHEVIRGLTVSTSHIDTHYAVGAYDGYDVSIVDRFDTITGKDGKDVDHTWAIIEVTLQGLKSAPHVFLYPKGHDKDSYQKFFMASSQLQAVNGMFLRDHDAEFHNRYDVFALPSRAHEAEDLFPELSTQMIAARFWPHAIEILDGRVYVYITEHRLVETVLGATLQSAVWLAEVLDQPSED